MHDFTCGCSNGMKLSPNGRDCMPGGLSNINKLNQYILFIKEMSRFNKYD